MTERLKGTLNPETRLAFALFSLALLSLWVFLPQTTLSVRDEANYLGVAQFFLSEEGLDVTQSAVENDGLVPWITRKHGRAIPQHPLGLSFLVLPFLALGGWKAAFVFSTLTFLVGGWFFLRLLEREGVPVHYGVLYFVFPPFLLYTRTFMADVPSMVLALIAVYYLRPDVPTARSALFGGLALGVALLIKSPNTIFVLPLAVSTVWRAGRAGSLLAAGTVATLVLSAAAAQVGLNVYFLDDPFSFSYDTSGSFRPAHAGTNLRFYLLAWTFVFPALWLGGWEMLRQRRRLEFGIVLSGILFYSVYTYIDRDASRWLGWIRGQRFLLPYAGLMLVYYAAFWSRKGFHSWVRRVSPGALLVALALYAFAAIEQRERTEGIHRAQQWVYGRTEPGDAIIYNRDSCKFVHGIFGPRVYYRLDRGEQFKGVLAALPDSVEQVCVVETDHRYRKGIRYAANFAARGRGSGWTVTESHDLPDGIVLLWAERSRP